MRKWECTVCGYIHEGDEPPDECPVCSADKSMFVEITTNNNKTMEREPASMDPAGRKPFRAVFTYARFSEHILTYHLHPIAVHTPNGIVPMSILFLFIAAFLRIPLFETIALYSLMYVLIIMPAVVLTGYEVWQKRYRGAFTSVFKIKISAAIVTVFTLLALVIWRFIQPEIVAVPSVGRWIYLGLSLVLLAAVGLAGHMGGKLVFGSKK